MVTTKKTPAAKAKPPATKAEPKIVAAAESAAPAVEKTHVELKLKGLLDLVTVKSGVKKAQVKAVAEALLQEMGDALSAGQVLNLPGFGKARVARPAETPTGSMTLKLRRGTGGAGRGAKAATEGLASPDEDS